MSKKVVLILLIGILFRLFLTANGNFLFNMDNARDMVDVREMVVLKKLRLTGPTSAIEGFYNGPAWYYLLSVPFVLSGGDPYASILMEIILWAIGGFFLLQLVSRWGRWLIWPIGALWVASNYIVLTNLYAFNPNPVTLLSPLWIYLLIKYLETKKAIYSVAVWLLGGFFFNFEMNFGIFMPVTIFASLILTKNLKMLRQKEFWLGFAFFVLTLLPQVLFDLKHQFIMSKAVLRHLSENSGGSFDPLKRFQVISSGFFETLSATLINSRKLTSLILVLLIPVILSILKKKNTDRLFLISLIFIVVPFLGYLILPVTVNAWHWGGEMAVSLILVSYLIYKLWNWEIVSKAISLSLTVVIIWFGFSNIVNFFTKDFGKPNLDPSLYKNEISAIDYVYKYAKGENFKVYTFMPSIYDFPYQYLFWWYGQKKYGFIPADYAYAPSKPQYIGSKDKFEGSKDNYNGLVFLIKEPNRGHNWKSGWEADYRFMELLSSEKLGSIEIEVRREVKK